MLILLGMPWSRSKKGKEGMSPSKRAWLNAGGSGGFRSNDVWGEGVSGEFVSGGTSILVC